MDTFTARYCSDPQSRRKWLIYGGASVLVLTLVIVIVVVAVDHEIDYVPSDEVIKGRDILRKVPLIDSFNNVPFQLDQFNISKLDFTNTTYQTDVNKLGIGRVAALFLVAKASCDSNYKDAVQDTLDQIDVIKRVIAQNPSRLTLVTTPAGINEAFSNRKIACLIGVNGGHSIDSRLSVLRLYHELGVRFLSLTQFNCSTPWADSNYLDKDEAEIGLTAWGESVIMEMNRLGMIIDLTDSSQTVAKAVLEKSKKPVIFSHSAAYSIYNHTSNVRDDIKDSLIKNKGLIMVNFAPDVLGEGDVDRAVFIKHLNHLRNTFGVDRLGIGANFDSQSDRKTKDLEDVSKYPSLFDILKDPINPTKDDIKWTTDDLEKLAGNNFQDLFTTVFSSADAAVKLQEKEIPQEDLHKKDPDGKCRSSLPNDSTTTTTITDGTTIGVTASITVETDTTAEATTETTDEATTEITAEATTKNVSEDTDDTTIETSTDTSTEATSDQAAASNADISYVFVG